MIPKRSVLAITMGDPAGVGPEIIVKAAARPELRQWAHPVVVGDAATLRDAIDITKVPLRVRCVTDVGAPLDDEATLDVVDLRNIDIRSIGRSHVSREAGQAAHDYLQIATKLACEGRVGAVVTAPLNKESLALAGWVGVGHTELLADFCGIPRDAVAMMLASDRLRVVHVSTHVSMRQAVALADTERIVRITRLGAIASR